MPLPAGLRDGFFDVNWDVLSLANLERWLERMSGQDEGQLWEAKGGFSDASADDLYTAMSAFGNADGGYLVLGVGRDAPTKPWRLKALKFSTEPKLWVSHLVGEIIDPPPFDVNAWPVGPNRHVAVVAIGQKADPPVITPKGAVHRRRPGESRPVVDPAELRSLVHGGEEARTRAKEAAQRIRAEVSFETADGYFGNLMVAMAAVGSYGTSGPFTSEIARIIHDAVLRGSVWPRIEYADFRTGASSVSGRRLSRANEPPADGGLAVLANDRAVVVTRLYRSELNLVDPIIHDPRQLEEALDIGGQILGTMGCVAPVYVSGYAHKPVGAVHFDGWIELAHPTRVEVDRIVAQLRRGRGEIVLDVP